MKRVINLFLATVAFTFSTTLFAENITTKELLQTLCEGKVVSQEDCDRLSNVQEQERLEQRAERRKAAAQQAEVEAKNENAVFGKLKDGGISFGTEDGNFTVTPMGRVQLDYRNFGGDAKAATADTFDIRRAFLGLEGKFYKYYTWAIVGDFGSSGANILDEAYLNINWWTPLQIRVGQFKVPFSLEERTSDLYLDFMERSMGNAIVPNKERGIMLHGVPYAGTTYALGLTTGQGKNGIETSNAVDSNDITAVGTVNFAEIFSMKDMILHLGLGYSQGTQPIGTAISGRTEARGITFFSPSAFTGTELDRTRTALEAAVAYGPFKFQGEMMQINYSGTSSLGLAYDKSITSQYLEAMWMITGENYASSYKDGKFGRINPKRNFDWKTLSGGAWEVGIRYSQFNAGDFDYTTALNAGSGTIPKPTTTSASTTNATAITLGAKFILNPRTRLMFNYVDTKFDSPVIVTQAGSKPAKTNSEKTFMLRFQYDF